MIKKLLDKYKNMSIQARASIWYSVCSIIQKGINFLVIPIYTRILTTSEYGVYTVFQSWRDLLIIFATLNLYCGVFTKAMVDYKDDKDRYTSSMQGLSSVITTIFLFIYLINSDLWSNLLGLNKVIMILLIAYYYVYPAYSFWYVRERVEYKYSSLVIVTLIISILTPTISLLLLKFTNLRESAVILGSLIIFIIVGLFFYIRNFIKGKVFYDSKYWKHALSYNIPLIPHYLSLIILGQADRIMISNMVGSDKAGIYGLAYSVSQLMTIFISAINGSLVPWIYEKLRDKDYKPIISTSNSLCILVGVMTLGAILISPELVYILGGDAYREAIVIIPIVSLSVYCTFCYDMIACVEFYYNATKYVMVASSVGAILNIVLNYLLIPVFGYIAAAYTTLFCYGLFMVMHYVFTKRVCKLKINNEKVFDYKFIFISVLVLLVIMFICMVLYNYTLLRYLIILLILVMAYIFKDKIVILLKRLKS